MKASLFAFVGLRPQEFSSSLEEKGGRNDGSLDFIAYEEPTYSCFGGKSTLLRIRVHNHEE